MAKIRIPQTFLLDHEERELPTPDYQCWRGGFLIDTNDPALDELLSDALHYAQDVDACSPGLVRAARALLAAVAQQRIAPSAEQ